jgi:hypothetical protein
LAGFEETDPQHDLRSLGTVLVTNVAQHRLTDEPTNFRGSLVGDSSETDGLGFAQQQVPLDCFCAEQQHPDRRPSVMPTPRLGESLAESNGQTTDVSTYKTTANHTRQRPRRAALTAARAFENRWWSR